MLVRSVGTFGSGHGPMVLIINSFGICPNYLLQIESAAHAGACQGRLSTRLAYSRQDLWDAQEKDIGVVLKSAGKIHPQLLTIPLSAVS
jgi:hypothetical protein